MKNPLKSTAYGKAVAGAVANTAGVYTTNIPTVASIGDAYKSNCIRFRIETITNKEHITTDELYIDYHVGEDTISISSKGDTSINGVETNEEKYKNMTLEKLSKDIFVIFNKTSFKIMTKLMSAINKQQEKLEELNKINYEITKKLSRYERVDTWENIYSNSQLLKPITPIFGKLVNDYGIMELNELRDMINNWYVENGL